MKIDYNKMDYIEKGASYSKIIILIIVISILILTLCINAFAMERWEAEPYIGKEVNISIFIRIKNEEFKLNLTARLVDIIEYLGHDYVALKGRYNPPILIPCKNVINIRRKR